jgi:hypothetical protein
MNRVFFVLTRTNTLFLLLLVTTALKLIYYLTRPLFEAGPDANGYIPAALAFADKGITSTEIPGMPVYPSGYPLFLSLLVKTSEVYWIQLSQICQAGLFLCATLMMWKTFQRFMSIEISNFATLLLVLSPAWFVASGEAMYETLLFFFVAGAFYFLAHSNFNGAQKIKAPMGGMFASLAVVTHPRVLVVFLIGVPFLYQLYKKQNIKVSCLTLVVFIFTANTILYAYLGFLRSGTFTLSTALWISMTYHDVFKGCSDFFCVAQQFIAQPSSAVRVSLENFYAFWSPHSGSWARGTWFHNVSLLAVFRKLDLDIYDAIFSAFTSISVVFLYFFGLWRMKFANLKVTIFLFLVLFQFIVADVIVYGDNRHRLIALPFMAPAIACSLSYFWVKMQKKLSQE